MRVSAVAGFLLAVLTLPAQADPRDDALSAMMRCTGIKETPARLSCYDSTVLRVRGALLAPQSDTQLALQESLATAVPQPAPAPPPSPLPESRGEGFFDRWLRARPPQTNIQEFGSESLESHGERAYSGHRRGDLVDSINARVVAYRFLVNGHLVVSLDNGQEWLESTPGGAVGRLAHPALFYSARIERDAGGSGSYLMRLTGMPRVILVRRIR